MMRRLVRRTQLISLRVLVSGHPVPMYAYNGQCWIEAQIPYKFSVEIENMVRARIAIVPSVNGRSLRTGEPLQPDDLGYVLDPGEECIFRGWECQGEVSEFMFSDTRDLQSDARKGTAMGEIECAVYEEKQNLHASVMPIARQRVRLVPGNTFERRTHAPPETHSIRYDTKAALKAMGIPVREGSVIMYDLKDRRT
jgi:hypothetical protein